MKIVIDAREYPTSTGRYVRKLIENLEKLNSEHEFVILLLPKDFDAYQPKNKKFSKLAAPFPEFTFKEQFGLLRFIRNLKADLVHFPIVQQPILYRGKKVTSILDLTALRFKNPATPLPLYLIKKMAYSMVIKSAAKRSAHIITISDYVKNDLLAYLDINPNKITTTYNAADKIDVQPEPVDGVQAGNFLLYVGRFFPHKNIRRLIDAFGILKKTNPKLKLVLVGKKDLSAEQNLAYAKQHGIKDVIHTGYVPEGQLRWLYENCSVYCFPSLSEGFGLPSLEAMVHGAPVASSNATCLPEVNGDAAHYFDPLDTDDMAEKINDILTDKKLRDSLIKKGYLRANQFSWRRMAEETLAVYDESLRDSELRS